MISIRDDPRISCAERTGYPPRITRSDLGYMPFWGGWEEWDDDEEDFGDDEIFYGNETDEF